MFCIDSMEQWLVHLLYTQGVPGSIPGGIILTFTSILINLKLFYEHFVLVVGTYGTSQTAKRQVCGATLTTRRSMMSAKSGCWFEVVIAFTWAIASVKVNVQKHFGFAITVSFERALLHE